MPTQETRDFELYARSRQQQIYRTAYLLCGDTDRAQDLTQTTLAKLFQHWRKASRATSIDAYAKTVLTRTYLAEERTRSREDALHTRVAPPTAPDQPDLRVTLIDALATLTPKSRAVIVLRYWDDLPIDQVAALLDCHPGTVKSSCSRALRQLRARLGEDVELYAALV
ncbi:SigE family RNA polymerase sigma factor [Yinghuangia seranimata]|uniref:SigE family RNA polymerase sigma factor n=1 Tax=Yinghuangia seranimata TaxID=408067 RepID=UPI00248AF57B|nr:SigE family RNA polymerase sigma factor [Yinghuangia seranimata]MDI2128853.1 SigE family RNA polymerase sigma factor [Yinghuangia seranimata]